MNDNDRRIGILTFHRTTNFGSALQTYGLYKKILDLGWKPEIIDYRCPEIEKRESLCHETDYSNLKSIFKDIFFQPRINEKAKNILNFSSTNMNISQVYTPGDISTSASHYEKFFVGSDIVWGGDITNNDRTYFLDFLNDTSKKFAFSSSVGHREVLESEATLSGLLKDFSQIAVREDDGAKWVNDLINITPPVVCDPTMLLGIDEWEKVLNPPKYKGKYVLVYFDSDDHKCSCDALKYAKRHGLIPIKISYGLRSRGFINVWPTSLSEFVGLIKHAHKVFTASYHGILFSLYYHKNLIYYSRSHNSRLLTLESRLGINCCGDYLCDIDDLAIDYDVIDKKMMVFKEHSIEILRGMLEA